MTYRFFDAGMRPAVPGIYIKSMTSYGEDTFGMYITYETVKVHAYDCPDRPWSERIDWNELVAPRLTRCLDNASQAVFDARVSLAKAITPKDYHP